MQKTGHHLSSKASTLSRSNKQWVESEFIDDDLYSQLSLNRQYENKFIENFVSKIDIIEQIRISKMSLCLILDSHFSNMDSYGFIKEQPNKKKLKRRFRWQCTKEGLTLPE